MSTTIENERTYLVAEVPANLNLAKPEKLIDIYIPHDTEHPCLRLRQRGNKYEITKKQPVNNDPTQQTEDTIKLTKAEFDTLAKGQTRIIEKLRYRANYDGNILELDIFEGRLKGLIIADFEFDDQHELNNFIAPEFCIHDVSYEPVIAGGILSGLRRSELRSILQEKYNYDIDKTVLSK